MTESWQKKRLLHIELGTKHYVCLGKRDGFFFRARFKLDEGPYWGDFKIKIPWCNIAYIACTENQHQQVKIGIKLCAKPRVEQCFQEERPQDNNNNNQKKKPKKKTVWRTISASSYPKSIQEFCSKPKIIFRFLEYKYNLSNVKKAIYHHSKILPNQRSKTFNNFQTQVSYKYDQEEKKQSQTIYRGACDPYLQNHQTLFSQILNELGFMFDASKGRKCTVCKDYVGYLEQHPICIAEQHTIDSCDSNIIKAIWTAQFKHKNTWMRNKISSDSHRYLS